MAKISDVELYRHFLGYVEQVNEDGICFVAGINFEGFVSGLGIKNSEQGFKAYVTTYCYLCFNIDEMKHFFDDFEKFKELFMKQRILKGGKGNEN